jgi:hypothetical protein
MNLENPLSLGISMIDFNKLSLISGGCWSDGNTIHYKASSAKFPNIRIIQLNQDKSFIFAASKSVIMIYDLELSMKTTIDFSLKRFATNFGLAKEENILICIYDKTQIAVHSLFSDISIRKFKEFELQIDSCTFCYNSDLIM